MSTNPTAPETPAATPDVQPAAANTLGSVLQTAIASVRNRTTVAADLTSARAQLATVTTERDTARTERDQAKEAAIAAVASCDAAVAQLGAIAAFFGVKPEELAGKDAGAATQLFAAKLTDATIEKVAGLGFPVDQLPKQTESDVEETKLTGAARTKAFFAAKLKETAAN
jgi:hypothetical protein